MSRTVVHTVQARGAAEGSAPDPRLDCVLVVVTYRSASDLPGLLDSVPGALGGLRAEVLVVDNASDDDVAGVVAGRPGAHLLRAGANLGYAGAINLALDRMPPARWVAVLNPDLTLAPGSLATLVACGERTGAGAVVPALLDGEGHRSASLRREPTVRRALGEALLGDLLPSRPDWAAELVRDPVDYASEHPVEWATGAVVLIRGEALSRVGHWDPRFFLYSEETDYLRRLREVGLAVWFTPAAVARHRGGGSGQSPDLVALLVVNRVRYALKWHGRPAAAAMAGVSLLHCVLRLGDPGHRRALRALLSPRSRDRLPGASRSWSSAPGARSGT
ncbi:glycosyltransferase family 2 protein [Geodermatophilus nigrescens]|uniref:Glycosyltransferase, GT2 family n=1 Tax=Geodermatophilus nigrescens TaxID=1070870 RepID=A0A1M5E5J2_9ACTN|nr:glycosyltransferase family 2 protein [Geodermatophilus nigrescens]SHF74331.1 Glycosyltransferase, GT2 family [Geodermatophilus nigrescens]